MLGSLLCRCWSVRLHSITSPEDHNLILTTVRSWSYVVYMDFNVYGWPSLYNDAICLPKQYLFPTFTIQLEALCCWICSWTFIFGPFLRFLNNFFPVYQTEHMSYIRNWKSVVGMMIQVSNSGRGKGFWSSKMSRPALGPTQPHIWRVPGVLPRDKAARAWDWPLNSI